MADSGGLGAGGASSSFLPIVVAAAAGAVLAVASSYFVHLYVTKQMDDQERSLRKSMARELKWRMKSSRRRVTHADDDSEEEDDEDDVDRANAHAGAQPQRGVVSSIAGVHHPHGGVPKAPTSAGGAHPLGVGVGVAPVAVRVPTRTQVLRGVVEGPASRSFSPTNIPRFLSPVGSHNDLTSLTVPAVNMANPLLHQARGLLSPPTSGLQDGIPIRAVSVHSTLKPDDEEEEVDEDDLVDAEEEDELQEEQRRAEEDLLQRQHRQLSENRHTLSPRASALVVPQAAITSMNGAIEGVVMATVGGSEAPEGGGKPMLHSISVIQDNVHHPGPNPEAADILRQEPEQEDFVRVNVAPLDQPSVEDMETLQLIQQCLALRDKYVFREDTPVWRKDPSTLPTVDPQDPFKFVPEPASEHQFKMVDGVVRVYKDQAAQEAGQELFPVLDATTFFTDMHHVLRITSMGPVRTLAFYRLKLLEQKFHLHLLLNAEREFCAQKSAPHRDLYNVRKVDTHVHHSACMNQKHLLRFIKSKLRKEPDEVVIFRDGTFLTLKEVFESLKLTSYDLNVDLLDVHADKSIFHRFDKFNLKYNPCGVSRLREIFIKQENLIQGRFLAELTQEVFTDLKASKYQMAEYRISIYGRKPSEWDNLASWALNNNLWCPNVVWLIQLPRLYSVYKDMGIVTNFQMMLDNIFLPLFEVTVDPASHPQLHVFLKHVVGFDMVDDESKNERRPTKHMPKPEEWNNPFNPAYAYYTYYCYANLFVLNKLRESKNMSIIRFRPHCGEAGDIDHLAAAFLTVHNIAHGNNLRRSPALQYLYYLKQIGLAMSPLSNNSLFLDYHKNPFPLFFARGLNVSLSTDDPLMIHLTKEPLVEEYSIAAQVWRLSSCDLCEIARNSVYQSGFAHTDKEHWIGPLYYKRGHLGNDIHNTNVPHIRMEFRHTVWQNEMRYVHLGNADLPDEIDD